ncbi:MULTISPECIES: DUF6492 family protein [unclassified Methylobacterium]|uniref:DUF6492 family protein n=1 Tax=unclassified Methylobacterium TaxID=2615210 RepID=UPI001237182D|nr:MULTISPECIES: DUF6492 family protein [Methylobacterium]WFT83205.1 DUF6492 family protein [Methylobacterium nodulans]
MRAFGASAIARNRPSVHRANGIVSAATDIPRTDLMRCDIVVVLYEAELALALLQAESIAKFIDPASVDRIIYCINDEDPRTTSDFIYSKIYPLLEKVGIRTCMLFREHFTLKTGNGYCLQQIQKLETAFRVQTDFYVAIDTKNFLVKNFSLSDLFVGSYPATFLESYEENDFRRYMKSMYLAYWSVPDPHTDIHLPAMATPFVFEADLVRGMIAEIERRERTSFGPFFERNFGASGGYSEFLLYSAYLYSQRQRAGRSRSFSLTSWGDTPVAPEEIHVLVDTARNNPDWKMCGIHKARLGPDPQRTLDEIRAAIGL